MTATRSISDTLGSITRVVDTLTAPAFALVKLLGSIVAFILGLVIFWRLIGLTLFRSPDLLVDTFANASGDTALDPVLIGLSQRGRERLLSAMELVNDNVKKHVQSVGPETYHAADKTPLPRSAPDQTMDALVASLKDLAPKEISPVVQLLNVAFPPRGTKVSTTLQRRRGRADRVGVTFEIVDLRGRQEPRLYTIWERSAAPPKPVAAPPQSEQQPAQPRPLLARLIDAASHQLHEIIAGQPSAPDPSAHAQEDKEVLARYTLGQLYEDSGDLDQARTLYEDALKQQPGYGDAKEALKAALQSRREASDRYMALLWPATLWLALELAKREMLAAETRISPLSLLKGDISLRDLGGTLARLILESAYNRYQGQVHNFLGALYLASMSSSP